MNSLIFLLQLTVICGLTLICLRMGKELLIAWLSLLVILMNLFLLKQITLFGLNVTSSDALGVGYFLGLNLMQEFFGRKEGQKLIWISLFISCTFLLLSFIHLSYLPNAHDKAHTHFKFLLQPMPRILFASLFSFSLVQLVDLLFYGFLKGQMGGKYLSLRVISTLLLCQALDTVLFSYLGLYGLVASVPHVICFSLAIKGVAIAFSIPFVSLSKKYTSHAEF